MLNLVEAAFRAPLTGQQAYHLAKLPALIGPYMDQGFASIISSTVTALQSQNRPFSGATLQNYNLIVDKIKQICSAAQVQEQRDAGGVGGGQPFSAVPPSGTAPTAAVPTDPAPIVRVSDNPPAFEITAGTLTRNDCTNLLTILESSRDQQPDAQGQAFLKYNLLPLLTARNIGSANVAAAGDVVKAIYSSARPLNLPQLRNLPWLVGIIKQLCSSLLSTATLAAVGASGADPGTGPAPGPSAPTPPTPPTQAPAFDPQASLGLGRLGQPGSPVGGTGGTGGTGVGVAAPTQTISGAVSGAAGVGRFSTGGDPSFFAATSAPDPLAGLKAAPMASFSDPSPGQGVGLDPLPSFSEPAQRPPGYGQYRTPSRAVPTRGSLGPGLQVGDPCSMIPLLLRRKMNQMLSFTEIQGIRIALIKLKQRFPNEDMRVNTWLGALNDVSSLASHKQGLINYIEKVCNPKRIDWSQGKIDQFITGRQQNIQTPGRIALQEFLQQGGLYSLDTRGVAPWATGALAQHGPDQVKRAIEQSIGMTMTPSEMAKLTDQGWHAQKGTGGDVADARTQIQLSQNMIDSAKRTIASLEYRSRSTNRSTQQKAKASINQAESLIRRQGNRIEGLKQYISPVETGQVGQIGAQSPLATQPPPLPNLPKATPRELPTPTPSVLPLPKALKRKQPTMLAPPKRARLELEETQFFEDPMEATMGYTDEEIMKKPHADWKKLFKSEVIKYSDLWHDIPSREKGEDTFVYRAKNLKKLRRVLQKVISDKKLDSKDVQYFGKMLRQVRKVKAFKELEEKFPEGEIEIKHTQPQGKAQLLQLQALLDKTDQDKLNLGMDEMMMLYEIAGGSRDVIGQFKLVRTAGQEGYRKKKKEYDNSGIEVNLLRQAVDRSAKLRKKPKARGEASLVQKAKARGKAKAKAKSSKPREHTPSTKRGPSPTLEVEVQTRSKIVKPMTKSEVTEQQFEAQGRKQDKTGRTRGRTKAPKEVVLKPAKRTKPKDPVHRRKTKTTQPHLEGRLARIVERPYQTTILPTKAVRVAGKPPQAEEGSNPPGVGIMMHRTIARAQRALAGPAAQAQGRRWAGMKQPKIPLQYVVGGSKRLKKGKPSVASGPSPYTKN